jgi:hypothetical protein
MKPGIKTTEFWLSLAAMVVGTMMASGVFADGSMPMKIGGMAMSILAALGYTYNRTKLKAPE